MSAHTVHAVPNSEKTVTCPACGEAHALRDCSTARDRSLVRSEIKLADMEFLDAADAFLAARTVAPGANAETSVRYIKPNSESTYREYVTALGKFWGGTKLRDIDDGQIRIYQERRAANVGGRWCKKCGQNRIQKEVAFLLRMLRCAQVWTHELDEAFDQLPTEETYIPRVPEPELREKFFRVAESRDEWLYIYYWAVLSRRLTLSTFELRMVRLGDIDLRTMLWSVEVYAAKNKRRIRTLPLETAEVIEAVQWLMNRARRLGSTDPSHHLFPWGVGSKHEVDPARPMTKHAIKNAWNLIKRKAGLDKARPYDIRHWGMTEMAERGRSIHDIMAFAGHMNARMQRHYIAISDQAKRQIARSAEQPGAFDKKPPAKAEWPHEAKPKWLA